MVPRVRTNDKRGGVVGGRCELAAGPVVCFSRGAGMAAPIGSPQRGDRPDDVRVAPCTPARARATATALRAAFVPFDASALGFGLWRYDGGPWTALDRILFDAPP